MDDAASTPRPTTGRELRAALDGAPPLDEVFEADVTSPTALPPADDEGARQRAAIEALSRMPHLSDLTDPDVRKAARR